MAAIDVNENEVPLNFFNRRKPNINDGYVYGIKAKSNLDVHLIKIGGSVLGLKGERWEDVFNQIKNCGLHPKLEFLFYVTSDPKSTTFPKETTS